LVQEKEKTAMGRRRVDYLQKKEEEE